MNIFYFPLENIQQRMYGTIYAKMTSAFKKAGVSYTEIVPQVDATKIEDGGWVMGSASHCKYCLDQMSIFMDKLRKGEVQDGDVLYFDDLWFPGLEAVAYTAHLMNIKLSVYGFIHAGSFTQDDFVHSMQSWARDLERSWFTMSKGIFVGSEQTKKDIVYCNLVTSSECLGFDKHKIIVTGLPFEVDKSIVSKFSMEVTHKEPIVMFSHRDDPDKHIEDLLKVLIKFKQKFPDVAAQLKYMITSGGKATRQSTKALFADFPEVEFKPNLSKMEYYQLLAKSSVLFSSATQENFGVCIQEGLAFGVRPVCPNRVSYKYLLPEQYLYNDLDAAVQEIYLGIRQTVDISTIQRAQHHPYAGELIVHHILSQEGK